MLVYEVIGIAVLLLGLLAGALMLTNKLEVPNDLNSQIFYYGLVVFLVVFGILTYQGTLW